MAGATKIGGHLCLVVYCKQHVSLKSGEYVLYALRVRKHCKIQDGRRKTWYRIATVRLVELRSAMATDSRKSPGHQHRDPSASHHHDWSFRRSRRAFTAYNSLMLSYSSFWPLHGNGVSKKGRDNRRTTFQHLLERKRWNRKERGKDHQPKRIF